MVSENEAPKSQEEKEEQERAKVLAEFNEWILKQGSIEFNLKVVISGQIADEAPRDSKCRELLEDILGIPDEIVSYTIESSTILSEPRKD